MVESIPQSAALGNTPSNLFCQSISIILGLFAAEPAIVQNLRQTPRIFIPSIVSGELYYGALRSTRVQDNLARIEQLAARDIV